MVISTSTERIVSSTFTEQIPTTNQERASTQPITVPEVAPTTTTEEALLFPIDLLLSCKLFHDFLNDVVLYTDRYIEEDKMQKTFLSLIVEAFFTFDLKFIIF